MLLVISDASVLIDIECSQLTEAMFSLPMKFAVPDILFSIEVHGTIWLVKSMLKHKKIDLDFAQTAFDKMQNSGSRLPWAEVIKMLDEFSTKKLKSYPIPPNSRAGAHNWRVKDTAKLYRIS